MPDKPRIPTWLPGFLISIITATAALGGFYFLTDWRLTTIERGLEKAGLDKRVTVLEAQMFEVLNRTGDSALTDWNRWRATKDALDKQHDRDIENLRRRPSR